MAATLSSDASDRRGGAKAPARVVLSANGLLSGRVVWWDGFGWSESFSEAAVAQDDDARGALAEIGQAEEAANTVVGAALVPLGPRGLPSGLREAHRLAGPSITLPTALPPRPGAPRSEA